MKKIVIIISSVFILTIGLSAYAVLPALAAGHGSLRVATAQGLLTVQGKDVLVEVLVGFLPGEDGPGKARSALRRMYPHAIEVDSEAYALTGLVWDQFFDSTPGNDFVTVSYNPNNTPSEEEIEVVVERLNAALNTWTSVSDSRFVFQYEGTTDRCPSLVAECRGPQRFDGNNDVGWVNIREKDVLGVTWYGLSIDEFDMALDNGVEWNWYFGADPDDIPPLYIDTETVWLHEFGHALGLDHSDVIEAVMYAYYSEPRRSLDQDEEYGIRYLYPDCKSDLDCDDGDLCTEDFCDESTGICSHEPSQDDPDCQCAGAGEPCAVDDDCCSLKCRGKPGSKRCR